MVQDRQVGRVRRNKPADRAKQAEDPDAATPPAPLPPLAVVPLATTTLTLTALLTALAPRYGFHRDELYFLAAGHHPAWGYDDQPPLTPLLARFSTAVFGETPAGLRVVATLAAVVIVVLATLIARELGAGAKAQTLAAICTASSGLVLAVGHMVSTATFDLLMWLLVTWIALRLLRTRDPRCWPALGLAVGVAGQNKDLIVLLVAALLAGILTVGPRDVLRGWRPWLGALIALAIVLPNVIWQARHGWPQLTVARGISEADGTLNRTMFVPQQILFLSPLLVPVWVLGFRRLLRDPAVRWARAVAVAYAVTCAAMLAIGGKAYYALALLIVVMAAGCEPLLAWMGGHWRTRRARLVLTLGVLLATVNAVLTLPLLPPRHLGIPNAVDQEQGEQVGWPALVRTVADGWAQIPADQRANAVLYAVNYGEAGAIAHDGPDYGLPYPYSGHVAFYGWARPPDSATGPILVVAKESKVDRQRPYFTGCRQVGRVDNGHGVDNEEQHAVVLLCAGTTEPWSQLWPHLRKYY